MGKVIFCVHLNAARAYTTLNYVKTVNNSFIMYYIRNDVTRLFECFCEVVGPTKENTTPWILQKFPEHFRQDEMLSSVPNFVYPCDFDRLVFILLYLLISNNTV